MDPWDRWISGTGVYLFIGPIFNFVKKKLLKFARNTGLIGKLQKRFPDNPRRVKRIINIILYPITTIVVYGFLLSVVLLIMYLFRKR